MAATQCPVLVYVQEIPVPAFLHALRSSQSGDVDIDSESYTYTHPAPGLWALRAKVTFPRHPQSGSFLLSFIASLVAISLEAIKIQ